MCFNPVLHCVRDIWTLSDVSRLDRDHVRPAMEALEAAVVIWSCWAQQAAEPLDLTLSLSSGPESQRSYEPGRGR